ncbi:hypothetical protein DY000_02041935 [Brassica cretica]|uniref:Proteasome subunit beta n=1 Tax=Brassica cretica TaxID=69181 RepID=A0ABQ7BCL9_BRACR|nr:hypothetical protein DY000_02041935 [Brassica cretica]
MECVLGLVGKGFAILLHKNNEDKIMLLDSHKLVAASGEPGDLSNLGVQFTEYVQKNVSLYKFRNGIPLTTAAAANFTRGELATALRKLSFASVRPSVKNPYSLNILMAGYDNESGASLYYIDYIATLHKVDKGAFGYGSYFSLSTMDRHYRSDMSVEEAIELVDKCILEIRSRLVVAPPNFVIKIVDKDGARDYAWRQSVQFDLCCVVTFAFVGRLFLTSLFSSKINIEDQANDVFLQNLTQNNDNISKQIYPKHKSNHMKNTKRSK